MASTRIVQLRPYQQQAISDLRMAYRSGSAAPVLVAPTGMGKTVVFAAITQAAAARGPSLPASVSLTGSFCRPFFAFFENETPTQIVPEPLKRPLL